MYQFSAHQQYNRSIIEIESESWSRSRIREEGVNSDFETSLSQQKIFSSLILEIDKKLFLGIKTLMYMKWGLRLMNKSYFIFQIYLPIAFQEKFTVLDWKLTKGGLFVIFLRYSVYIKKILYFTNKISLRGVSQKMMIVIDFEAYLDN